MADVTPPVLQGPSSKEKKYDRQLRLWAASGQAALEDAHILLINSGSGVVGIETLKNLVLPGQVCAYRSPDSLLTAACPRNWSIHNTRLGRSERSRPGCQLLFGRREPRPATSKALL